jgi:hypothetical protein
MDSKKKGFPQDTSSDNCQNQNEHHRIEIDELDIIENNTKESKFDELNRIDFNPAESKLMGLIEPNSIPENRN